MASEVISASILIVFAHIFISKLILWLQVPILGQPIVLRIEYYTGERHETKIKAPRHQQLSIVKVYLPMVSGSWNSFLNLFTWSLKLILQLNGSFRLTISRQLKLLWFQCAVRHDSCRKDSVQYGTNTETGLIKVTVMEFYFGVGITIIVST